MIAVNPFIKLPHLYNRHMMEQYEGVRFGELSPHVFAIADASFRSVINEALCLIPSLQYREVINFSLSSPGP